MDIEIKQTRRQSSGLLKVWWPSLLYGTCALSNEAR